IIGPFTEKWQLWQNASGSYAIVLRGTVLDAGSILEDLISFLVPAIGRVTVGHIQIDYSFAASSEASLHFGFALGTLLLLKDPKDGILVQLASKVPTGSQIYITGTAKEPPWRPSCAPISRTPPMRRQTRTTLTRPTSTHSRNRAMITMLRTLKNRFCNIGLAF